MPRPYHSGRAGLDYTPRRPSDGIRPERQPEGVRVARCLRESASCVESTGTQPCLWDARMRGGRARCCACSVSALYTYVLCTRNSSGLALGPSWACGLTGWLPSFCLWGP